MSALAVSLLAALQAASTHPAVRRWEFIYTSASFTSAHASTIAETGDGLAAAWFGGSREGADDVAIWLSRMVDGKWTPPVSVADGVQPDGTRHPCWNPVLAPWPDGSLRLFYKVGPSPATWWGMVSVSRDGGRSWTAGQRLPNGIIGPVKNKPVWLADGTVISPSSTESPDPVSRWRIHFELSADSGRSWTRTAPPELPDRPEPQAIQPTILLHRNGALQALGRTRSGFIFESWSLNRGKHWGPVTLTKFPNPNSGIDAVSLRDGRQLLVYNHSPRGRSQLFVALSHDGRDWRPALELETEGGEYSYPAVIQARDGTVHITYTWNRNHIMYVALDPRTLER
jgi:predicted neuraminidase